MPQISLVNPGVVGASPAKALRANAVKVLRLVGVRGRRRRRR